MPKCPECGNPTPQVHQFSQQFPNRDLSQQPSVVKSISKGLELGLLISGMTLLFVGGFDRLNFLRILGIGALGYLAYLLIKNQGIENIKSLSQFNYLRTLFIVFLAIFFIDFLVMSIPYVKYNLCWLPAFRIIRWIGIISDVVIYGYLYYSYKQIFKL